MSSYTYVKLRSDQLSREQREAFRNFCKDNKIDAEVRKTGFLWPKRLYLISDGNPEGF
jgi:hypothetical protein